MERKIILLIVAAACVALYFYGQHFKNNKYLENLPVIGGLAFGLNTLLQLS
jgi:hypothetical protein